MRTQTAVQESKAVEQLQRAGDQIDGSEVHERKTETH
jgi:hypothetical protein